MVTSFKELKLKDVPRLAKEEIILIVMAPYKTIHFFWFLKKHGFYEIITRFKYEGKEYGFKTLVQLDADFINFIPDIHRFPNDDAWLQAYELGYNKHHDSMEAFIYAIERYYLFWYHIFDGGLILINIKPFIDLFSEQSTESLLISAGTLAGSGVARAYLKKKIIANGMKAVMWILKKFVLK